MFIRQGLPGDAEHVAPLILSTAPTLLTSVFQTETAQNVTDFFQYAWQLGEGQYGCRRHWVAVNGHQVVGVVTAWHNHLGKEFGRATLRSVTDYYSAADTVEIITRNAALSADLHPPLDDELMVGHLCVVEGVRGHGIGARLMDEMQAEAVALKKQSIVLDVELSNTSAMGFYQYLGFTKRASNNRFARLQKAT